MLTGAQVPANAGSPEMTKGAPEDDDEVLEPGNPFYERKKDSRVFTKVYPKRWLMLGLFVFYAALVCSQWIMYSIIANVVEE